MIEGEDGKNVTYKQYSKFLENNNENRLNDPNQLGEESQESLIRQEELKQRKNKIIQLLNGEVSDEEEGGSQVYEDEDRGEEDPDD